MRIAGFLCNYPCSMSCKKEERAGIGRLVKDINFRGVERLQSIRFDADASKGSSEEVEKSLDVSLNHIDTYQPGGRKTLLLGQTTESGGGGVK